MELSGTKLTCIRGSRTVFEDLDFAVKAGELLAVTGPNGAGKTSLLRMVAGLLRASAGTLRLDGGDAELSVPEQAHYLGHTDAAKPSLSVAENLHFWTSYLGEPGGEDDALQAVGLAGLRDLPAGYLSAGQRRRLSIARLLAAKRPLWLLDEPASALDASAQIRLAELMRTHLSGGGIILAATHGPLGVAGGRELHLDGGPP
jgi:heme exporter protein A